MEDTNQGPGVPPTPICPNCKRPLTAVGWLQNQEAGLFTFYHADPECMVAINCQLVGAQRRVQVAEQLPPRRLIGLD